eukprot:GHVN01101922.1.p1 GENE.GHVN01101922.1~~GHVN01101922.1.p1  ORF type:complete len:281 (+),score=13.25 GHVN01101922.1:238-1080(+)
MNRGALMPRLPSTESLSTSSKIGTTVQRDEASHAAFTAVAVLADAWGRLQGILHNRKIPRGETEDETRKMKKQLVEKHVEHITSQIPAFHMVGLRFLRDMLICKTRKIMHELIEKWKDSKEYAPLVLKDVGYAGLHGVGPHGGRAKLKARGRYRAGRIITRASKMQLCLEHPLNESNGPLDTHWWFGTLWRQIAAPTNAYIEYELFLCNLEGSNGNGTTAKPDDPWKINPTGGSDKPLGEEYLQEAYLKGNPYRFYSEKGRVSGEEEGCCYCCSPYCCSL